MEKFKWGNSEQDFCGGGDGYLKYYLGVEYFSDIYLCLPFYLFVTLVSLQHTEVDILMPELEGTVHLVLFLQTGIKP